MDINEQIKAAENLLKYTQAYLAIKKLLKTVKTGCAEVELKSTVDLLSKEIKKYVEVI